MSPPAPPTVDVLLPVWNGEKTIRESIASIQAQSLADITIVVVDDGSTDGTGEILAEIAAADHRVHVVTQANGGLVDALNAGLRHCTAEFVARHDADDLAWPDRLQRQVDYFRAHADCVAVSTWAEVIDGEGRSTGGFAAHPPPEGADATHAPAREPFLMHPFLMVRRSAFEAVGGYRYAFHAEDADLYWRLREIGRLHIITEVFGSYRVHASSITGRSVVNGRISAASSQLSAISALRRAAGRADLSFPKEALGRYERASTLRGIHDEIAAGLDEAERGQFRVSLAAQLMQLSGQRPYELDLGDSRFIRAAAASAPGRISTANLDEFRGTIAATAGRLLAKGRLREAIALAPPALYPRVAGWLCRKGAKLPLRLSRAVARRMARRPSDALSRPTGLKDR